MLYHVLICHMAMMHDQPPLSKHIYTIVNKVEVIMNKIILETYLDCC